jgi:hypothetical protein
MKQHCLVYGRRPTDPHHLRFVQSRALGRKVSDEFTMPLCRTHHREIHRGGDEALWWQEFGIDPLAAARMLWLETHPLPRAEAAAAKNEAAGDTLTTTLVMRQPRRRTNHKAKASERAQQAVRNDSGGAYEPDPAARESAC